MKRTKPLFLALLCLLCSCNRQIKQLTESEMAQIYSLVYGTDSEIPDLFLQTPDNMVLYSYSLSFVYGGNYQLGILKNEGGRWKEFRTKDANFSPLDYDEVLYVNSIDSVQTIILDRKPYLYFKWNNSSGGSGYFGHGMNFVLYDYLEDETYGICFIWHPVGVTESTDSMVTKNLRFKPLLAEFLENKVAAANLPAPDKQDEMCRTFLRENNDAIKQLYTAQEGVWVRFYPVKTDETLVDRSNAEAENSAYRVWSMFKGPVLALEKATGTYQVVWVPENEYDWVRSLTFNDAGYLVMDDDLCIDLRRSTYMKIPKNNSHTTSANESINPLISEQQTTADNSQTAIPQETANRQMAEEQRQREQDIQNRVAGAFGAGNTSPDSQGNRQNETSMGGSYALRGRTFEAGGLPRPAYSGQEEGRIVINITVNADGNVIMANISNETTIDDANMRKAALDAAQRAKFNPVGGNNNQSGTITYNYRIL